MDHGGSRHRYACFHEAGHCLGWWYFGIPIDRAVVPTIDDLSTGVTVERLGRHIVEGGRVDISPAKIISMDLLRGMEIAEANKYVDNFRIISIVAAMMGSEAQARYMNIDPLELDEGHGQIDEQAISNILAMVNEDLRDFFSACASIRSRALVRSDKGWRGISHLAGLLEEHGEISGDTINSVLSETYAGEAQKGCWFGRDLPSPIEISQGLIVEPLPWVRELLRHGS